jgi:hypothetical protein
VKEGFKRGVHIRRRNRFPLSGRPRNFPVRNSCSDLAKVKIMVDGKSSQRVAASPTRGCNCHCFISKDKLIPQKWYL